MMYGNKLATAIKVNGKVLREFKDTVYIPFGSEYEITIKNLNTTRAVVNVYIDGDNVVSNGLVINPNETINLERSIKNGNLKEGNRFKFIERTANIEKHRGIDIEDGLIRIEYQFEKTRPVVHVAPNWQVNPSPWQPYNNGILRGYESFTTSSATTFSAQSTVSGSVTASASGYTSDVGITVPGGKSTQSFSTTHVGEMDPSIHNLVLKLVGDLGDNKPVDKPITVKHKVKCVTCNRQNKHTAKFCSECGTALEIFA